MKVSEFLTLEEATRSATAKAKNLKNDPDAEQFENIKWTAKKLFDPCCKFAGGKLTASSFFRNKLVNKAVGGSTTSDHETGEAIDITTQGLKLKVTNADIFNYIKDNLVFDQLIWEFGTDKEPDWVHVGLRRIRPNRKQVLRAIRENGKVKYIPYA